MKQPSTDWREQIAADEEAHLARVGRVITALQSSRSNRFGKGRALHRKQVFAARGTFEVYDGLPEHARHGAFATPVRIAPWCGCPMAGPTCRPTRSPISAGSP